LSIDAFCNFGLVSINVMIADVLGGIENIFVCQYGTLGYAGGATRVKDDTGVVRMAHGHLDMLF